MSKMAAAQQEHTAVLMAQLEQLEHQSRVEHMQREVLKQARSLIVDMTDAALEVENKPNEQLILSSIEADALVQSFKNAVSGGLGIDLFEDITDIERFRALEKIMNNLSVMDQRLSQTQREAKAKLLLYRQEIPVLEEAVIIADALPVLENKIERIKNQHEQALPKWRALNANKRQRNEQVKRNSSIMGVMIAVVCIIGMLMPEIDPSFFGMFPTNEGYAETMAGGSCCLLILAISGLISYRENRTMAVIERYDSLEEPESQYNMSTQLSMNQDLEERLELYLELEAEDPGLWTEEIQEIRSKLNSGGSASSLAQSPITPPPYSVSEIDLEFDERMDLTPTTKTTDYSFESSFFSLYHKYSQDGRKVRSLRVWLSGVMDHFQSSNGEDLAKAIEIRKGFIENLSDEIFQSDQQAGQPPPYSMKGEMHNSGYEVIQYPEGFGEWYWKDTSNEKWVLWE